MRIALCWNKAALLLGAAALSSCANDNLPKPQKLGPLRVLGLVATSPEVEPGDGSTITAVISDFTSGGRALTFEWKACEDPGVALGATPTCEGAVPIGAAASGTINPTATTLAATPFTGAALNNTYVVTPDVSFLSSKSLFEKFNGVPVIVTFTVSAGSESVKAFRRLNVRDLSVNPTPLNTRPNPPTGIASLPATEQDLTPSLSDSADTYSVLSTTGATLTRTEKLTVSWYTTDGEFEFSRTDASSSNKWTPPSTGTPKGLLLLRDDRGGISNPLTIGF